MSLVSNLFLLFVAVSVLVYYIVPHKFQWLVLLCFSYIYYLAGGVRYVGFILFSTLVTWGIALAVEKAEAGGSHKSARNFLVLGLILNFGMLGVIKYTNFMIENLNALFHMNLRGMEILLPLGISFYTFQSSGYLLDVYWKRCDAERNPVKYALFVSFFPQILQGPIGRYSRRPGLETESEMRVIAGKARRLNLKTIPGIDTRPTTDRIKETLFNILQPELLECRFLDLFSGSGGIGIEALSRGASYAVFVEKNPKAAACIRENLAFTKLAEDGKLLNMDVLQALRSLEEKGVFDIIFMDPPYNNELERQVLEYLKDSTVADKNTLIIVEADLQTDFSYVESLGYRQLRSKEYKTNKHVFLERA